MFNNIIYFIVVLLIYNINYPENAPANSLSFSVTMLFLTWLVFAGYCRWGFRSFYLRRTREAAAEGGLAGKYQGLIARLSILAVFLFALAVYLFNLKYWIQWIPGFERFSVLQGALALSLFFFYLSTIWYFAYPAYRDIFGPGIQRSAFIRSNIKLNLPILFPWVALSFVYDLLGLTPWSRTGGFLSSFQGQLVFFASFLSVLMLFMPRFLQYWWGCRPLGGTDKARELMAFLREKGFKYRHLLDWPIFEGRLMTAGIMGIVPRYRYILISDSLLEGLSVEELKAVVAHEMGHAKYRHLLFYILFFVGYMVISFGLFDLLFYFFAIHPAFSGILMGSGPHGSSTFYLALSIPMLLTMFLYFRYLMGFFMRNFERQADLYSAVIMGTPRPTITSLEKIAFLSGQSGDLPSWHHFSIRERVIYLWRTTHEKGLIRRHNRFVAVSFLTYVVCMAALGYGLNFSGLKQYLGYSLLEKAIQQQILKDPNNIALDQSLAMVYQEMGNNEKAIQTYERILELHPNQAVSLNNLAWLLVTAPEKRLRNEARGLELAKKAVALERSPVFLDTLAEAYYVNGFRDKAVKTIEDAIALAKRNRGYYEKQLEKFLPTRR